MVVFTLENYVDESSMCSEQCRLLPLLAPKLSISVGISVHQDHPKNRWEKNVLP